MADLQVRFSAEILARSGFAAETILATTQGPLPAGWIVPGHRVLTGDAGVQRVLRTEPVCPSGRADGDPAVVIGPDALGPGCPSCPVTVSPDHLVMIAHPLAELYFDAHRIFVAVRHLAGLDGIASAAPGTRFDAVRLALSKPALVETDGLVSAVPGPHGEIPAHPVLEAWQARLIVPAAGVPAGVLSRSA